VRETRKADFMLMPPKPGVCQICATKHEPSEPHNQQSLYYQYRFYAEHGRWPTWEDAMAHCDEETKVAWKEALREHGVKI